MIAIRQQDDPPVPYVQLIGEMDGKFVETWAPLEFPEGPAGPKRLKESRLWEPKPRDVARCRPDGALRPRAARRRRA